MIHQSVLIQFEIGKVFTFLPNQSGYFFSSTAPVDLLLSDQDQCSSNGGGAALWFLTSPHLT